MLKFSHCSKLLFVLLAIVFAVHFVVALMPLDNLAWDEVYYVDASRDTILGHADNIEHPPLAKLITGISILALGDGWVAWRLPVIMFSLMATVLTYLIAKRFVSEKLSLFAASLMSLSTVFLLVGSCAILDMPCLAFGLFGVYLALRGRFGLSGLAFGLSFLCKELGLLLFVVTFVYLVLQKTGKFKLLWFGGLSFCVAFFGIWIYDLAYASSSAVDIGNPVVHWLTVIFYQLKLNGVTRAVSDYPWYPPWGWVSPFGENALNPLKWISWDNGWAWRSASNWTVEYMMFPLLTALPIVYFKRKLRGALLCWGMLAATYLPWLAAGLFVKTEANFYIVFSVPFLAIGSAILWSTVKNRKLRWGLALSQLAIATISFLYYFPIPLFGGV